MAINKEIEINNIKANYWRIVGFNLSVTGKMCQVFLCGYESEETRAANKNILALNYIIKNSDFDKYITVNDGVYVASLYQYLHENVAKFNKAQII